MRAEKHIVLVVDQAGWHRNRDLVVPEGLHLVFLPAYAPELQPAERLLEPVDEVVVHRVAPTFDDLIDLLNARCQVVQSRTQDLACRTSSIGDHDSP